MKNILLAFFAVSTCLNFAFTQNYQSAESVEYDPSNNRWLVSNSSNIISDDGQGNLSIFGTSGTSYGLEVLDDKLYGIFGGSVRVFDLASEALLTTIPIPGAGFLNGMTTDGLTTVYVTDFGAERIYSIDVTDLDNPVVTTIVSDTGSTPNGVVFDEENNRLVFVSWGSNAAVRAVDLSDNTVSTIITTSLGNIDGIDRDAAGNYYLASWSPNQISKFDPAFANPLEVISTPFIDRPADICYSIQNDTLAIPIGSDVVFVGFDVPVNTLDFTATESIDFSIFPNPLSNQSYVEFELQRSAYVQLQIIDQQGKLVRTLLEGNQSGTNHKVLLAGHDLATGIYFLRFVVDKEERSKQVIVR